MAPVPWGSWVSKFGVGAGICILTSSQPILKPLGQGPHTLKSSVLPASILTSPYFSQLCPLSLPSFLKVVFVLADLSYYLWVDSVLSKLRRDLSDISSYTYDNFRDWQKIQHHWGQGKRGYFRRSIWETFTRVKVKSMRTNFIDFLISISSVHVHMWTCVMCRHAHGRWKERNNMPPKHSSEALHIHLSLTSSIFNQSQNIKI